MWPDLDQLRGSDFKSVLTVFDIEGKPLEDVLGETETAPGDFVRNCKQLVDLLRQIAEAADPPTAGLMREARDAVLRGVVAYTGV